VPSARMLRRARRRAWGEMYSRRRVRLREQLMSHEAQRSSNSATRQLGATRMHPGLERRMDNRQVDWKRQTAVDQIPGRRMAEEPADRVFGELACNGCMTGAHVLTRQTTELLFACQLTIPDSQFRGGLVRVSNLRRCSRYPRVLPVRLHCLVSSILTDRKATDVADRHT